MKRFVSKGLFAESIQALSKESLIAASPYNKDLASKLVEPAAETKALIDGIITTYGKYDSDIRLEAASQPGFFSFVNTVKEAFKAQKPPMLGDYEDIQSKLASLVGYAYYLATKQSSASSEDKSKLLVYFDLDKAKQVATSILNHMGVDLRMRTLLDSNPKFKDDLGLAICSSVFNEKKKAAETTANQLPTPVKK